MQNCIVTRTAISPAVAPRTRRKQTCTANITRCNLCHAAQRLDSLFAQHASMATCSHGAAAAASSVTRTCTANITRQNTLTRARCNLCHANSSKTQSRRCAASRHSLFAQHASTATCSHGAAAAASSVTRTDQARHTAPAAQLLDQVSSHNTQLQLRRLQARRNALARSVTRTQARHTGAAAQFHGKVSAHNMQARLHCKHGKLCHTNSSKAHSSSYAASRRSLLAQHASTATANTAQRAGAGAPQALSRELKQDTQLHVARCEEGCNSRAHETTSRDGGW